MTGWRSAMVAERRRLGVAFLCGALAALAMALAGPLSRAAEEPSLDDLRQAFRRPAGVPFPAANPYSDAKRRLGAILFDDPGLSSTGTLACSGCHRREAGFADTAERSRGVSGHRLGRHTPTLWNLAWAPRLFWDGRAASLEQQVTGPIEAPDEMAQPLEPLVARLAADAGYRAAFAAAFPGDGQVTRDHLVAALATNLRTLVSPPTRFDRWVAGDDGALTEQERAGFRLFVGKAGCATCHRGWAFTDHAFHDIGLPDEDRGRGAVLRLEAVDHAFKTPGLREIGRSAPYMHDGSLPTLEAVVRHYETGIVDRPSLSPDLPRSLRLDDAERAALIAFLGTLTSQGDPQPPAVLHPEPTVAAGPASRAHTITQADRAFRPAHVIVAADERLWILNNDTRTHNVRVSDPALDFDSGAQEPGETVELSFPNPGSYLVYCGIHPTMELRVEVARTGQGD